MRGVVPAGASGPAIPPRGDRRLGWRHERARLPSLPRQSASRRSGPRDPAGRGWRRARAAITAWPGHAPAPPTGLPGLAAALGLAALHWKDEGRRAGPEAVGGAEALGAAYAVKRLLSAELARRGVARAAEAPELESGRLAEATRGITLASGPEAGFALAVAWGARRFHARCVALLPAGSPAAWREALAGQGAEVLECPGGPAGERCAVRDAARRAEAGGGCSCRTIPGQARPRRRAT
ncbi:pyridoxal-phosphate dependent enzyme [Roseomonas mucosa]|nr:pyridoxal-phosphate dependent enzyme [Roseomonas mucosa]